MYSPRLDVLPTVESLFNERLFVESLSTLKADTLALDSLPTTGDGKQQHCDARRYLGKRPRRTPTGRLP